MNIVVLMGNLGRDPEMRYTSTGKPVTEFSLAINKGSGENKKTIWIKCTAWNKTAEFAGEHLRKGSRVVVEGSLDIDSWTDKETGRKVERIKVVVRNITIASSTPKPEQQEAFSDLKEDFSDMPF